MTPGDQVVYLPDPLLYGIGTIESVVPNGRLLVTFPDEPRPAVFNPHELELHSVWDAAATGSIA